jgi:hypothetical protein
MLLTHRRRQAPLEPTEQLAETAVAVAVGVDAAIFLPQDQQRHAGLLQFDRELRPVRLVTSPLALLNAGAGEKPRLQSIVCQFSRQWPAQPRHRSPLQVILDGAAGNAEDHRNLSAACPASGKPEHLS